jgi:hypothetical protein
MDKIIKVVKSIRIDEQALNKMDDALCILDSIIDGLHEIVQEDDFYKGLYEDAKHAWGALSDFMDAYAERDQ